MESKIVKPSGSNSVSATINSPMPVKQMNSYLMELFKISMAIITAPVNIFTNVVMVEFQTIAM
jgi:hypothetical protein